MLPSVSYNCCCLWKDGGLEEKENQFKESSGKLRDLFKVVQPHQRFVRFRPTLSIEYQSWIDNTTNWLQKLSCVVVSLIRSSANYAPTNIDLLFQFNRSSTMYLDPLISLVHGPESDRNRSQTLPCLIQLKKLRSRVD